MKITQATLDQILSLRRARDNLAAQLGAAYLELDALKQQIATAIETSRREEKRAAEAALAALGLDSTEKYSFRVDGVVLVLRAGEWVEV